MTVQPVEPIRLYRPGVTCAGCGSTAWHVGRRTAQCARCAMAYPIARQPFGGERG